MHNHKNHLNELQRLMLQQTHSLLASDQTRARLETDFANKLRQIGLEKSPQKIVEFWPVFLWFQQQLVTEQVLDTLIANKASVADLLAACMESGSLDWLTVKAYWNPPNDFGTPSLFRLN